jgi:threonine dehydrogenase-like Zn-dependent dehydrogenase
MKAAVYYQSEGLVVEDVPIPHMEDDQILVQVVNAGFCGSDHSMLEGGGLPDGTILGHEVSGIVVDTGAEAKGPEKGTRVIVRPTYCGICRECLMGKPYLCQVNRRLIGMGDLQGAFAEYITVFPQMLIPVPEGVDSRNAAMAEPFAASLHGIKCSGKHGGSALVMGAGTIGLALIKLLKLKEFSPIVVSEPVKEKHQLARDFGADVTVNSFAQDLRQHLFESSKGIGFETVFECSGVPESVQSAMDFVAKGGTVCIISVIPNEIHILPMTLTFKEIGLTASYSNTHEENIQCLRWMAEGRLDGSPMITDLIHLEQLPQTYRDRIHTGKAIKVILKIGDEF